MLKEGNIATYKIDGKQKFFLEDMIPLQKEAQNIQINIVRRRFSEWSFCHLHIKCPSPRI